VINDGDMSTVSDDVTTEIEYAYNSSNNLSVPIHIVKTAKNLQGTDTTASEVTLYYDGFSYKYAITGLLTKKVIENGDHDITFTYSYDSYGNLCRFRDGRASLVLLAESLYSNSV
jgi:hypothetical protein